NGRCSQNVTNGLPVYRSTCRVVKRPMMTAGRERTTLQAGTIHAGTSTCCATPHVKGVVDIRPRAESARMRGGTARIVRKNMAVLGSPSLTQSGEERCPPHSSSQGSTAQQSYVSSVLGFAPKTPVLTKLCEPRAWHLWGPRQGFCSARLSPATA